MKIFKTEEQKLKAIKIAGTAAKIALVSLEYMAAIKLGRCIEAAKTNKRGRQEFGTNIKEYKIINSKQKFDIYGEENGFVQELAVSNSLDIPSLDRYNSVAVVLMERGGEPDTWFEDVIV